MEAKFIYQVLPSGAKLVRFSELHEIYKMDDPNFNPDGLGHRNAFSERVSFENYKKQRNILTPSKLALIEKAKQALKTDKDFLELVYKAKSQKRKYDMNKFGGNLSMPHYAIGSEKMFKKSVPGAKKLTLDMAFQVGTFMGYNYEESFIKILKTVLMCQAMNINLNIDVFDSDTSAIARGDSYIICNVAKSNEKLNFRDLLASSHREFFDITLFNGYGAAKQKGCIRTFLSQKTILKDLGSHYDVIGGNILLDKFEGEQQELVSKILKIGICQ